MFYHGNILFLNQTANSPKSDLEFFYACPDRSVRNAMGQRVMKVEKKKNIVAGTGPNNVIEVTTIYVRDATGNVMGVYTAEQNLINGNLNGFFNQIRQTLTLEEHHTYGVSRTGMETYTDMVLFNRDVIKFGPVFIDVPGVVTDNVQNAEQRTLKMKRYELNSHQSSVHLTISDRKLSVQQGTTTQTAFYTADVINYSDYYSFGMQKPGRHGAEQNEKYRYKHQGQESDSEILSEGNSYAYEYRMSDARLGRFWSVDPLAPEYPHNSPYAFSENRLIDGVELEGLEFSDYKISFRANINIKSLPYLLSSVDIQTRNFNAIM